MTATALQGPAPLFRSRRTQRAPQAVAPPVCLYLEVTNRCNLLCETCPRTFEELEPPADMSWELFTRIVDQVPDIARVVLHGVGEPMLVKALPRMIRYLKDRGVYVLFNTNGTLLPPKKHRELIDTGLDELRVSLDAADAKTFLAVRGKNFFDRIVRNVQAFTALQRELGVDRAARIAVADRLAGNGGSTAGLRAPGRHDGRAARCICSAWCSTKPATAWRAPNPRCSSSVREREGSGRSTSATAVGGRRSASRWMRRAPPSRA